MSRGKRRSLRGRGRRGAAGKCVSEDVDVNEKRIEAASGSVPILNSRLVSFTMRYLRLELRFQGWSMFRP